MVRNSEGKIVDGNGIEVFTSDVFKKLSSKDNLIEVCPANKFIDLQIEKAYLTNQDDARKFVEFHSSKLLDDNFSLASDESKRNSYINNVMCFLGIANGLNKKDAKNNIMGGVFPTKNDNSTDSMVPMYLCTEMLKAKCLKYLDTPVNNLDNFDITAQSTAQKDSTLGQEFDKVISQLKGLDYDKEYFGANADMSNDSMNYLSACQIDPSGMVDIFAKCEEDKCVLYVTQGENSNNISMFNVEKKKEEAEVPQVATQEVQLPSIPAIEQPVTTAPTTTEEKKEVSNVDSKKEEEKQILKELEEAKQEQKQANDKVEELYSKLHNLYESMFKKTPFEEDIAKQTELNSMIANQQQQNPTVSINAQMFK